MALDLMIANKWLWGKHAFIHPEELGLVLPSYYDAPIESKHFIDNGVINSGDLKPEIVKDKLLIDPGYVSLGGDKYPVFPSEMVFEFIESAEQRLSARMSNTFRPIVATFKYVTINDDVFITYNKFYRLVHEDDVSSTPDSFAIKADKDGHLVKVSSAPTISINTTLSRSSIEEPFRMPEFPLKAMDTDLNDEEIDRFLGIANSTLNTMTASATGTGYLCIFYVPADNMLNKTIIEHTPAAGSFLAISNKQ